MSNPDEPLEREADRVASQVTGGTAALFRSPRHPPTAASSERFNGLGQPLPTADRAYFEPRLGHRLDSVRIHTDTRAGEQARALDAQAFTLGDHIYFGSGHYRPGSATGHHLLAHELVHTIQQGANATRPRVQRKPVQDPIHGPLIEDWRRRHGFPPGGVDEFGNRVGPTDAEIKYRLLPRQGALPLCPDVNIEVNDETITRDLEDPEFRQAYTDVNCLSSESQAMPPACRFSRRQERALNAALGAALSRVQRGLDIIQLGPRGRSHAAELAGQLFAWDPPTVTQVVARLTAVRNFLRSPEVRFSGRTCGDEACQRSAVAYVTGAGASSINICPTAFIRPSELPRTILHEALHWTGLDADPTTPEGYCEKYDCETPCLTKRDADAWAHYLDCLGKPFQLRRDFREEILESVREVP